MIKLLYMIVAIKLRLLLFCEFVRQSILFVRIAADLKESLKESLDNAKRAAVRESEMEMNLERQHEDVAVSAVALGVEELEEFAEEAARQDTI